MARKAAILLCLMLWKAVIPFSKCSWKILFEERLFWWIMTKRDHFLNWPDSRLNIVEISVSYDQTFKDALSRWVIQVTDLFILNVEIYLDGAVFPKVLAHVAIQEFAHSKQFPYFWPGFTWGHLPVPQVFSEKYKLKMFCQLKSNKNDPK